ncbi:MAG: TonB-dependent receptor [Acidobacteriota bacterium]
MNRTNAPLSGNIMMYLTRRLLLVPLGLATIASPVLAQGRVPDLSQVSIEDLMKIEVTSASRKEERVADVAAAVFVITHDDIRRSGMTSIPDLLRMVPGVQVAQINSNKWAVTVRGFNGLYADKLLVLVDGRSLYNRIFAGVFWDAEDLMLDDVDRIEVIRGPGAALWGANAVNGVINIVTKATTETQGGVVRVEGGRSGEQGTVRYGGTTGAASYRVYSQWTGRDQSLIAPGVRADDASHSTTTGFRVDWTTKPGALMVEGDFTAGQQRGMWFNLDPQTAALEPIANVPSDTQGGHLLGRWTHKGANGGSLQIQSFVDIAGRQETIGDYSRQVFDVDTQYHKALSAHHDLVAGVGYRFIGEKVAGRFGFSLVPVEDSSSLFTAFIQDEITLLGNRLAVTFGSQVQHDAVSGAGVQPTARAMWKASPRQRIWAATSRALRTPSLYERGIRLTFPPVPSPSGLPLVVTATGNPAAETENFVDAEAGYRLELGTAASIDVTGFVGRYEHLRTTEPALPIVQFVPSPQILVNSTFANQLAATTRGLEVAGHWAPVQAWRLDGSYTAFHVSPSLAATSQDPAAGRDEGSAPRSQWQVRSSFSPLDRATLGVAIFHVGPIEQLLVDAYTRADISAEWRFTRRLAVTATGQNLFEAAHAEFAGAGSFLMVTQIPRSANLQVRWVF